MTCLLLSSTDISYPCVLFFFFQNEAKAKGIPWTMAKCFDTACPVSAFVPRDRIADAASVRLRCTVNGETRQDGNTADMHFSVPFLLSYISRSVAELALGYGGHGGGVWVTEVTSWVSGLRRSRVGCLGYGGHGLGVWVTEVTDWVSGLPRSRVGCLGYRGHGLGVWVTEVTGWVSVLSSQFWLSCSRQVHHARAW